MPKMKQVAMPRCPQVQIARVSFREANKIIREARGGYKEKLWIAAGPLKGRALAGFLIRAAERMQSAGLYSEMTPVRDIAYSLALYMHRKDFPGGAYGSWALWKQRRDFDPADVLPRVGRGRKAIYVA